MIVEHLTVGRLACTCTILVDPVSGEAIVVDGGAEPERVLARLADLGARATTFVHTHAHIDHIGAYADLHDRTGAPGLLHAADVDLYGALAHQARLLGLPGARAIPLGGDLRDGDRLRVGEAELEVLHTPGHTPGSVSFAVRLHGATTLLSGDTLFAGAIGRWDLGGSSAEAIVRSIRGRLLVYPDATVVVPGHGPQTTIGRERTSNPFLVGPQRIT